MPLTAPPSIRSLAILLPLLGTAPPAAMAAPASMVIAFAEPEVFSHGGLDADRRRSIDENKVHVIYATATWCPPCKKMKAETWVDDEVVGWLNANAVVTPLDVDQSRADAQRLRVRAMPTIMLFRGSTEIARVQGYQSPSAFRGWLESSTGRGMPSEGADSEAPASRASVQDKLVQAQDAVNAGRLDEAAETYAWLWDNMRQDRAADELRRGQLAGQITALIEQHDSARAPFAERRDGIGAPIPAIGTDEETMLDWLTLNGVLGDDARTVEWVGTQLGDRVQLRFMRKHQRMLRPMLTEAGQWQDAATVVENPFAAVRLELMELRRAQRRTGETGLDEPTLEAVADLYAIAHTIDRAGMAERVSSLVLRTEDTPEVRRALVGRAIDAGYTKPDLAELIADDGSDEAQALRAELDG